MVETQFGKKTSAFIAIICSISASIVVTVRQIVIRKFKDDKYPPLTQVIDAGILEISLFSIVSIFLFKKVPFTWSDFGLGTLCGFLMKSAVLTILYAVSTGGPAGPV